MKALSFLIVLLPFFGYAQTSQTTSPDSHTEIGLNLGHAFDNAYYKKAVRPGGFIRSSVSLLKNRRQIQYGVTVEGGTNSNDYWYFSPGILFNHVFTSGEAYFYAGAMAGYICSKEMAGMSFQKQKMAQGYAFGLQGGFVQPLGKRLALTTELAVRSTQLWQKVRTVQFLGTIVEGEISQSTIIYFPVAVGLRYIF